MSARLRLLATAALVGGALSTAVPAHASCIVSSETANVCTHDVPVYGDVSAPLCVYGNVGDDIWYRTYSCNLG